MFPFKKVKKNLISDDEYFRLLGGGTLEEFVKYFC